MSKRRCPRSRSFSIGADVDTEPSGSILPFVIKQYKKEVEQLLVKEGEEDSKLKLKLKKEKSKSKCGWKHFQRENLSLDYTILYERKKASELISRCESEILYNAGHLAQIKIFGKWIDIPRKQVAFGDSGLTYTFSGNTVPARPWTPLLLEMRDDISNISGFDFNFVLVNRYEDGNDYMGEHKDDEKDLCSGYPIASLSLGQSRDFVFRHQDSRGKNAKRNIDKLTIQLENGGLLMMNAPTNSFWYHSLPKRTKVLGMRLNFTFRKMVPSLCKPLKVFKDKEESSENENDIIKKEGRNDSTS